MINKIIRLFTFFLFNSLQAGIFVDENAFNESNKPANFFKHKGLCHIIYMKKDGEKKGSGYLFKDAESQKVWGMTAAHVIYPAQDNWKIISIDFCDHTDEIKRSDIQDLWIHPKYKPFEYKEYSDQDLQEIIHNDIAFFSITAISQDFISCLEEVKFENPEHFKNKKYNGKILSWGSVYSSDMELAHTHRRQSVSQSLLYSSNTRLFTSEFKTSLYRIDYNSNKNYIQWTLLASDQKFSINSGDSGGMVFDNETGNTLCLVSAVNEYSEMMLTKKISFLSDISNTVDRIHKIKEILQQNHLRIINEYNENNLEIHVFKIQKIKENDCPWVENYLNYYNPVHLHKEAIIDFINQAPVTQLFN